MFLEIDYHLIERIVIAELKSGYETNLRGIPNEGGEIIHDTDLIEAYELMLKEYMVEREAIQYILEMREKL